MKFCAVCRSQLVEKKANLFIKRKRYEVNLQECPICGLQIYDFDEVLRRIKSEGYII